MKPQATLAVLLLLSLQSFGQSSSVEKVFEKHVPGLVYQLQLDGVRLDWRGARVPKYAVGQRPTSRQITVQGRIASRPEDLVVLNILIGENAFYGLWITLLTTSTTSTGVEQEVELTWNTTAGGFLLLRAGDARTTRDGPSSRIRAETIFSKRLTFTYLYLIQGRVPSPDEPGWKLRARPQEPPRER